MKKLLFFKEILGYILHRKKYWLAPIIIYLILLGILLVAGEGSVLSTFIYAIF